VVVIHPRQTDYTALTSGLPARIGQDTEASPEPKAKRVPPREAPPEPKAPK
jgi:hypothetical protein